MADRIPIGGTIADFVADPAGNAVPNTALEVRDLTTGDAITDLQPGTPSYTYDGQPFPTGRARADRYGFYGFTVPAGSGVVQLRTAAAGNTSAGPWVTAVGQGQGPTEAAIDAGVDRAINDGRVLSPADTTALVDTAMNSAINDGTVLTPAAANAAYVPQAAKGTAGGVASLGNDGKLPRPQMPDNPFDRARRIERRTKTGNGMWWVRRVDGTDYRLLRDVGDGWHVSVRFAQLPGLPGGNLVHQLHTAHLITHMTSQGHSAATRTGTWTSTAEPRAYGGSYQRTSTAGDAVTYTIADQRVKRVAARTVKAPNGGLVKVTIGGDATAANLLPTAQQLVTSGVAPSSILAANGGKFQPTDRVLDLYAEVAEWDAIIPLADNLPAQQHQVTLTATGHKRNASSDVRLYDSGMAQAHGFEDPTTAGAVAVPFRTLLGTQSAYEYAYEVQPTGTSSPVFLGNVHGYEVQDVLSVRVDGEIAAATDGSVAPVRGQATFRRRTRLIHPDKATVTAAEVDTTYMLNGDGLTVKHTTRWRVGGVMTKGYPVMFPVSGYTFDRAQMDTSPAVLVVGQGDDRAVGASKAEAVALWDADGTMGAAVVLDDAEAATQGWRSASLTWVQDRAAQSAEQVVKVYVTTASTTDPLTFSAGDVWESQARYLWTRRPSGFTRVFPT